MQIVKMKLSELVSPDKNVRYHNEKQIKEFARSLEKFGQIRPVVVDEDNVIRCGNGLVEAMRSLGYETADVYVMANLSENDKKKLMIADNRIYGLGVDNLVTINEFFEELKGDLDIPGYDEEILNTIVSEADEITEKLSEFGTLDDEEIEEMKAGAAKSTAAPQPADSSAPTSQPVSPGTDTNQPSETVEKPSETALSSPETNQSYVICPKCGEKIWL